MNNNNVSQVLLIYISFEKGQLRVFTI